MTEAATDTGPDAVPDTVDLVAMAAAIPWPSTDAAEQVAAGIPSGYGELRDLAGWLASTRPDGASRPLGRARCVVVGAAGDRVAELAGGLDVGLRELPIDRSVPVADALRAGIDTADAEVDSGADLLVVACPDPPLDAPASAQAAAAALVGALCGAEPVALLPRGALAIDTGSWVARAEYLRDTRRRLLAVRTRADRLIAEVASPHLAALVGLVLRASARRTPLLLDGAATLAAALLCHDIQPRAVRWWRAADTSPDPVHTRCCAELGMAPVLNLATSGGTGAAGLLCLPLVRAASQFGHAR